MNQFKKAKSKMLEQGKNVEKITDLKTAGVTQNNSEITEENENEIAQNTTVSIEKSNDNTNIESNIIIESTIQNQELEKENKSNNNSFPSRNESQNQNEKMEDIVQNTITNQETNIFVENETNISNDTIVLEDNNLENETKESTIEQQSEEIITPEELEEDNNEKQSKDIIPVPIFVTQTKKVESEVNQSDSVSVQRIIKPKEESEIVEEIKQDNLSENTLQNQKILELLNKLSQEAQQSSNTTTKKDRPNIFAPKEEPKSMRKSLVLKPTSVKKAESYCNKNGGSFNELIQTLLDNFIEEYGL